MPHHRPLRVQDDLLLGLGGARAHDPAAHPDVGDRLTLEAHFLVPDGHGDLLVLRHDVLAQPGPSDLLAFGTHPQVLFRTHHRLAGRAARRTGTGTGTGTGRHDAGRSVPVRALAQVGQPPPSAQTCPTLPIRSPNDSSR
jgi:hypothetical protein